MDLFTDLLLPPAKSTIAESYDQLFEFVHMSSLILTIGVLAAIIYFIIKYRRKSENEVTPVITHNNALEITWSVIPLVLVLFIFGWGFQVFLNMTSPPDDAYEVQVTAQSWLWRFQYKNGATSTGELHVPVDRPVRLVMSSNDVIHSFFVPDFRIKQDVVPGRYTSAWFNATETGESVIFCTEYCGTDHSNMTGSVIVHTEEDFEAWLAENAGGGGSQPDDMTPAEWGEQLVQENACNSCHSTDGTDMTGPTWQGSFGSERSLADGSTVTVDENYIRESILEPGAQIADGYSNMMPPYQGVFSDEELNAIIEYIKTLD